MFSSQELVYDLTLEISSGELSFANHTNMNLPADSIALSGMTLTTRNKLKDIRKVRNGNREGLRFFLFIGGGDYREWTMFFSYL